MNTPLEFRSDWERRIDEQAAEIQADTKKQFEQLRRSIGQLTRRDHLHRKINQAKGGDLHEEERQNQTAKEVLTL